MSNKPYNDPELEGNADEILLTLLLIVLLVLWMAMSNQDYIEEQRLECAKIGKVYNQSTDDCETERKVR